MSTDFSQLIADLRLWNNGDGIDVQGWLSATGDYEHAIAYAELFWPDFVNYDGCIFRIAMDEETYHKWIKVTNGNKTSVEEVVNHIHILDFFPNVKEPPSKEQVRHLGLKLRDMWEAKVKRDFPNRDIIVHFLDSDTDDLVDYQVTVFQRR